jgi:hypothetical protein
VSCAVPPHGALGGGDLCGVSAPRGGGRRRALAPHSGGRGWALTTGFGSRGGVNGLAWRRRRALVRGESGERIGTMRDACGERTRDELVRKFFEDGLIVSIDPILTLRVISNQTP